MKCSVPGCSKVVVARVRLYDAHSSEEADFCQRHLDSAPGDYPDNIETVTEYAREED